MNTKKNLKDNLFEINTHGGRINCLLLKGAKIFFHGLRGDRKIGSTHPCSPNFGKDPTNSGLPQHGPIRESDLIIKNQTTESIELEKEIIHPSYPQGVIFNQRISLQNNGLSIITTHTNNNAKPVPVNFGEHCYWAAPDGCQGIRINKSDVTESVKANKTIMLLASNIIEIPGQPAITLEQTGLNYAVLWSYQNPETKEFDNSYVCIEPLQRSVETFGKEESMIQSGKSSITQVKIVLD